MPFPVFPTRPVTTGSTACQEPPSRWLSAFRTGPAFALCPQTLPARVGQTPGC